MKHIITKETMKYLEEVTPKQFYSYALFKNIFGKEDIPYDSFRKVLVRREKEGLLKCIGKGLYEYLDGNDYNYLINKFINDGNGCYIDLKEYVNDEPLDSMDKSSYEIIKVKIFKKWCKKFMVDNLIFIHELDTPKLGKILKDKRIEKYYSVNSVTDFLGISANVLRNYETGRRSPRINVLYALCELYEINIGEAIKASLK